MSIGSLDDAIAKEVTIQSALLSRGAFGSSNLGQALDFLEGRMSMSTRSVRKMRLRAPVCSRCACCLFLYVGMMDTDFHPQKLSRVLIVSDGVATTGEDRIEQLQQKVLQLKPSIVRLDVLAFGGIRDERTLHALITAGLASDGVIVDGDLTPAAMERFGLPALSFVPVVPGAEWIWPTVVRGVQDGDAVLLYASVPPTTALNISACAMDSTSSLDCPALSGHEVTPAATALLERFWAGARIDRLLQIGGVATDEAVELSVQHRVLNTYTAMLVLETESDYDRFKIDRNALASILVIDSDGSVAELNRTFQPLQAAQATLPPERADADNNNAGNSNEGGSLDMICREMYPKELIMAVIGDLYLQAVFTVNAPKKV